MILYAFNYICGHIHHQHQHPVIWTFNLILHLFFFCLLHVINFLLPFSLLFAWQQHQRQQINMDIKHLCLFRRAHNKKILLQKRNLETYSVVIPQGKISVYIHWVWLALYIIIIICGNVNDSWSFRTHAFS